jgi:hypothetical protein
MRHFLGSKLGLSIAITGLSGRLQTPTARYDPVGGSRSPYRFPALLGAAAAAEAATSITSSAKPKLNTASPTNYDPEMLRRQRAPCRRILDMDLRPW